MTSAEVEGAVALEPLGAAGPARLDPSDVVAVRMLVSVILDGLDVLADHLLDVVDEGLDGDLAENSQLATDDAIALLNAIGCTRHLVLDLEVGEVMLEMKHVRHRQHWIESEKRGG